MQFISIILAKLQFSKKTQKPPLHFLKVEGQWKCTNNNAGLILFLKCITLVLAREMGISTPAALGENLQVLTEIHCSDHYLKYNKNQEKVSPNQKNEKTRMLLLDCLSLL